MSDGLTELLRDHPWGTLICLMTGIGVLLTLALVGKRWRDWRSVRGGDNQAAFMSREGIAGSAVLFSITLLIFLLSLRGLVTAIETVHALPPAQRAAALRRARHLTQAQLEVVVLYLTLVALVLGEGVRRVWISRRFDQRFGHRRGRKP